MDVLEQKLKIDQELDNSLLRPITREHLDCGCANCGGHTQEIYLTSNCHDSASFEAVYDKRDGTLTLSCDVCGEPVAILQIADSKPVKSH